MGVLRSSPLLALVAQQLLLLLLQDPRYILCSAQDNSTNSSSSTSSSSTNSANLDQFTYRTENYASDVNKVYPPSQWQSVRCADLTECVRTTSGCRYLVLLNLVIHANSLPPSFVLLLDSRSWDGPMTF
jgi:hypothetical protein